MACLSFIRNFSFSLLVLGFIISIIINIVIVQKRSASNEKAVYCLSKVATVKNIVNINHNSKIFNFFNSEGHLEGITTKYQRLLNLANNGNCSEGYHKCGILDTMGNILCIDNNFFCPINKLIIDSVSNKTEYLDNGFKEIYNENLFYNYMFYYKNDSINDNCIVSLLFSDEKPRYITKNNFILDKDAFKYYYGSELKNISTGNSVSIQDEIIKFGENIINILVSDNYVEALIKASFTLYSLLVEGSDEKNFMEYVEKQLETKENEIDKYYVNVGENAYIKNHIGFKSLNDIDTFTNFDYNIYKDKYPTKAVFRYGIFNIVFNFILALFFLGFYFLSWKDIMEKSREISYSVSNENNITGVANIQNNISAYNENAKSDNINKEENITNNQSTKINPKIKFGIFYIAIPILSFVYIGVNVGFIIYSSYLLHKNYKNNEKLDILNNVEADDFIKQFINEFIEECKGNSFTITAISLLGSSILFNIIGVSLFLFVFC